MKNIVSKEKINLILDGIENSFSFFNDVIDKLENNPNYLTDNEIYIILEKVNIRYTDDSILLCKSLTILYSFIKDSNYKIKLLKSNNFCSYFYELKNNIYECELLKDIDIDILLDNISDISAILYEYIYSYILEYGTLSQILKLLNNENVAYWLDNKDVIDDENVLLHKYFHVIIGTKFMNKCFPYNYYSAALCKKFFYDIENKKVLKVDGNILNEIGNIIKNYNICEEKKALIINGLPLYKEQKKYLVKYVLNKNQSINSLIESVFSKILDDLYNLEDSGILTSLCCDIKYNKYGIELIDDILIKVYENPNKEISNAYYEIICNLLANKIIKDENLDIKVVVEEFPFYHPYCAIHNNKEISINANNISSSWSKNLSTKNYLFNPINTIYHELTHEKQSIDFENNQNRFSTLKNLKDSLIKDYDDNYYLYNEHDDISFEIDADMKALLNEAKFYLNNKLIKYLNKEHVKSIRQNYIELKEKYDRVKERLYIQKDINGNVVSEKHYLVNELFDKIYTKEKVASLIREFPILLCEYNIDGTKKSFDEILSLFNYYKNIIESNKYTENDKLMYNLYKDIYKDQLDDMIVIRNRKRHNGR